MRYMKAKRRISISERETLIRLDGEVLFDDYNLKKEKCYNILV